MKKKLLIGILALSTCFVMTGCDVMGTVKDTVGNVTDKVGGFFGGIIDKITGNEDEEEVKSEYNVEAAKEYLKSQYVDKNTQTRVNYEVLKEFTYLGKTYTVDWSVDKPEAVKLKVRDDCVKVKVTKTLTEDTTYILTATVKAPDGTSAQVGFRRKVLAMSAVVPDVFEGAPVAETPYKFYVFNQQLQQDQYFAGEMNGYYYKTTTDHNKATDIFVEYLEGSSTEFYVYHEVEGGREYFTVEYGLGDDGGYHTNVYLRDTATTVFTYNSQYNAIVTTVNDSATDPNKLTDYFLGNRNKYNTISANDFQYASTNNVGRLAAMKDRTTVPAADKVARTYRELSLAPVYIGDYEMEVPENGDLYAEVNVKWEVVEGDAVTVDEELLTFANPSEMKEVTLKATITLGEGDDKVEQTKTFPVKVAPKTEAGILDAVKALTDGEALGNTATLTGKVTKIVDEYDPQYENVTVKMDVNGTELEVYRVKGTGADEIAPGYTITVSGILKNFKGTLEFDAGCTLDAFVFGEAPHEHVFVDGECECGETDPNYVEGTSSVVIADFADANSWANGTLYETFTFGDVTARATGTPTKPEYGLNTGKYYENGENWRIYQNESPVLTFTAATGKYIVSVKITYVSDKTGVLLLGKTQIESDQVVNAGSTTVTFSVGNTDSSVFNGQARITAIEVVTATGTAPNTDPGVTTTPPVEGVSTIAQVIAGTKGNTYKAEGTVVAVTTNGFILQDATDEIFVYTKSAHTYKVGDKVIVEGALDFYNKGAQFAQPTVTLNGTGTLPTAEPTVLTKADCEAFLTDSSINCNYVSMTGTMKVDGTYLNILFDSETVDISLYYVTDAQKTAISALKDKTVTVEGYVIALAGSSSPKHISFVLTDFVEVVAPKATLTLVNGTSTEEEVEVGSTLELPTPTAEGKTFLGWFDSEGNEAPATMPESDLTLTAKWQVNVYTVTVNFPTGDPTVIKFAVEAVEAENAIVLSAVKAAVEATLPQDTDDADYSFSTDLPETFALQNYEFTVVANATKATLTLVDGTSTESQVAIGAPLSLPTPTADGKTFIGWFDSEGKEAPATMPENGLTLIAKWEVNVYTATVKYTNDTLIAEIKFALEANANENVVAIADLKAAIEAALPANTAELEYGFTATIPSSFAYENCTFTVYSIAADGATLTVEQLANFDMTYYNNQKYYVEGIIESFSGSSALTYGNVYIKTSADSTDKFLVYGIVGEDGTRYDSLEVKPQLGDTIKMYGTLELYNTTLEMKNGTLISHTISPENKVIVELSEIKLPTVIMEETTLPLATAGATYADVVLTWTKDAVAYTEGTLTLTPGTEDVTVVLVVTATVDNVEISTRTITIVVKAAGSEVPQVSTLATFEFGTNPTSTSADSNGYFGKDGSTKLTSKDYTENGQTLSLTNCTNVYEGGYCADAHSSLKLGTSSKTGSFTFTVGANVTEVQMVVTAYKAKDVAYIVKTSDGTEVIPQTAVAPNASINDVAYVTIKIDTSINKSFTFTTVKTSDCRILIDTMILIGTQA